MLQLAHKRYIAYILKIQEDKQEVNIYCAYPALAGMTYCNLGIKNQAKSIPQLQYYC